MDAKKFDTLPEYLQKNILDKLSTFHICETLKNNPDLLSDNIRYDDHIEVKAFNPYKPIFVFNYTQLPKPGTFGEGEVSIQQVQFNFLDCLDIIQKQCVEQAKAAEPLPQFEEGEPVIYQCGNRFELGIVKSACGGDEYFVYYHMGPTASKTHARYLHKIENNYAFFVGVK